MFDLLIVGNKASFFHSQRDHNLDDKLYSHLNDLGQFRSSNVRCKRNQCRASCTKWSNTKKLQGRNALTQTHDEVVKAALGMHTSSLTGVASAEQGPDGFSVLELDGPCLWPLNSFQGSKV